MSILFRLITENYTDYDDSVQNLSDALNYFLDNDTREPPALRERDKQLLGNTLQSVLYTWLEHLGRTSARIDGVGSRTLTSPEDPTQFIEAIRYHVLEPARLMSLPPGHQENPIWREACNYANSLYDALESLNATVLRGADQCEQTIDADLPGQTGTANHLRYYIRFHEGFRLRIQHISDALAERVEVAEANRS